MDVTPDNFWEAVFGEDALTASMVKSVISLLVMMPKEDLVKACGEAINKVNRLETIGPMLDPTAWMGGARFNNARELKQILEALIALRRVLPDKDE